MELSLFVKSVAVALSEFNVDKVEFDINVMGSLSTFLNEKKEIERDWRVEVQGTNCDSRIKFVVYLSNMDLK